MVSIMVSNSQNTEWENFCCQVVVSGITKTAVCGNLKSTNEGASIWCHDVLKTFLYKRYILVFILTAVL